MSIQIELAVAEQDSTRWQKLKAWLTAIDEGINYDPQEHANAMIRNLWENVRQLETRLNELEGRDKISNLYAPGAAIIREQNKS